MISLRQLLADVREISGLKRLEINLRVGETAANDKFYEKIVREFFNQSRRRHWKFPLVRSLEVGVAVCVLPRTSGGYTDLIESSAHRNCKKAMRCGYTFSRIDFNQFLGDVSLILKSTDVRQGKLPENILKGEVRPCSDPPSRTNVHDYAYFGVLHEGKLVAYAGCLIAGELAMVEQLFGHADRLSDGIVPLLIVSMAEYIMKSYPGVRYYAYGSYFGAGIEMRRFKRKFGFLPHRVTWVLGQAPAMESARKEMQWIYRQERFEAFELEKNIPVTFALWHTRLDAIWHFPRLLRCLGLFEGLKMGLKIASGTRLFYAGIEQNRIVSHGLVTLSRCRFYKVEAGDAVIGPVLTEPLWRGRGIAAALLKQAINSMMGMGIHVFFIDTGEENLSMQRVIEKCGFGPHIKEIPKTRK